MNNWHFVERDNSHKALYIAHCYASANIHTDRNGKIFCSKCSKECPEDIVTQAILLNAFVYDRPGIGIYSVATGKHH